AGRRRRRAQVGGHAPVLVQGDEADDPRTDGDRPDLGRPVATARDGDRRGTVGGRRAQALDRDGRGPRDGGGGDRIPEREGDRGGARGGGQRRRRGGPADAPGAAREGRLDHRLGRPRLPDGHAHG